MSDNLMDIHAREKAGGLPETWRVFRYECFPKSTQETLYIELEGAVVPLLQSGKRKGQPNWRGRDRSTQKTVVLILKEHEQWCDEWERKAGKCKQCTGEGRVFKSWNHKTGTEYMQCPRCGGSGKAPEQQGAIAALDSARPLLKEPV